MLPVACLFVFSCQAGRQRSRRVAGGERVFAPFVDQVIDFFGRGTGVRAVRWVLSHSGNVPAAGDLNQILLKSDTHGESLPGSSKSKRTLVPKAWRSISSELLTSSMIRMPIPCPPPVRPHRP